MPAKQKKQRRSTSNKTGTLPAPRGWHRMPLEHRITVLACMMLISGGMLTSMLKSRAADTEVGLFVTTTDMLNINLIAIPEKRLRVSAGQNNSGTLLTVEVRAMGSASPLLSRTVITSSGGLFNGLSLNIVPGTYDITAKGYSHLRKKLSSIALSDGILVDFTDNGADPLLSGDVDFVAGNNIVNSLDLTTIVGGLYQISKRLDLDMNGIVNSLDYTNAVNNLYIAGDA